MVDIRLAIKLVSSKPSSVPPPARTTSSVPLLERVQYAIDCFDSGHNPEESFAFLRKVNDCIRQCEPERLTEEAKQIIRMLKPIIEVYGPMSGMDMNVEHTSVSERNESDEYED